MTTNDVCLRCRKLRRFGARYVNTDLHQMFCSVPVYTLELAAGCAYDAKRVLRKRRLRAERS